MASIEAIFYGGYKELPPLRIIHNQPIKAAVCVELKAQKNQKIITTEEKESTEKKT